MDYTQEQVDAMLEEERNKAAAREQELNARIQEQSSVIKQLMQSNGANGDNPPKEKTEMQREIEKINKRRTYN